MVVVNLVVLYIKLFQVFVVLKVLLDQRKGFLDVLHVYQMESFETAKLANCFYDVLDVFFT